MWVRDPIRIGRIVVYAEELVESSRWGSIFIHDATLDDVVR